MLLVLETPVIAVVKELEVTPTVVTAAVADVMPLVCKILVLVAIVVAMVVGSTRKKVIKNPCFYRTVLE